MQIITCISNSFLNVIFKFIFYCEFSERSVDSKFFLKLEVLHYAEDLIASFTCLNVLKLYCNNRSLLIRMMSWQNGGCRSDSLPIASFFVVAFFIFIAFTCS